MIVIDASVAMPWFLPDERNDVSERAMDIVKRVGAIAPMIFELEVRNVLILAWRRRRISREVCDLLLSKIVRLPIEIDRSSDMDAIAQLALRRDLTVYDASYLELSVRRALPIATLDRKLAEAAAAQNVGIV